MTASVLILDDIPEITEITAEYVAKSGLEPVTTTTAQSFRTALENGTFAGIIMDLAVPEETGFELLDFLRDHGNTSPIIFATGLSRDLIDMAERIGRDHGLIILGSIRKPFSFDDLNPHLIAMKSATE